MKTTMLAASLMVMMGMVLGCETQQTAEMDPVPLPPPPDQPGMAMAEPDPVVFEPAPTPQPQPGMQPGQQLDYEPEPAPRPAAGGRTYTVQRGDTLWSIAQRQYGNGQKWQDIVAANPGLVPEKMRVGQEIILP